MAIKKYKPTTPGRRGMSSLRFEEITSTSRCLNRCPKRAAATTPVGSQPVIRAADTSVSTA